MDDQRGQPDDSGQPVTDDVRTAGTAEEIGLGIGEPIPTDEELEGDGNGDEPFRNTPVSPNANR